MESIDTAFTRLLLKSVHADVREAFPEIKNVVRAAGVTSTRRGQYFVQIVSPGRPVFNYDCRAHNSADARYKAWTRFIEKYDRRVSDDHQA